MNCTEIMELISLYIDDMLDEHTTNMLERHLKECETCRQDYEELLNIRNHCNNLSMLELPENFELNLHEKLLQANEEERSNVISISQEKPVKKKSNWKNWKVYTSVAALFMIFILANSLNDLDLDRDQTKQEMRMESAEMGQPQSIAPMEAEMKKSTVENRDMAVEEDIKAPNEGNYTFTARGTENQGLDVQLTSDRKVIKNAYMDLSIENYDEKFSQITKIAFDNGGFVENSSTQYKQYNEQNPEESLKVGNISIRIPENRFVETVDRIKTLGIVTNIGISGQDITKEYRNTVEEIENLKVQEKRLREIMEKATNVRDILEVERELSRVRGEINRMSGDVKRWDELVSLSTINITLNELSPKDKQIYPIKDNVWEKAKKGFIMTINGIIQFIENLFIKIVSILPILLILSIVGIPLGRYILRQVKSKEDHQDGE